MLRTLAAAALLGFGTQAYAALIFDNWNEDGVAYHAPTSDTVFTTSQDYYITQITNWHARNINNEVEGTIGLMVYGGGTVGTWTAFDGDNPSYPGCTWVVTPEAGFILPAGTYKVVDSDPLTWSSNGLSDFCGFSRIEATPVPEPAGLAVVGASMTLLARRRRKMNRGS